MEYHEQLVGSSKISNRPANETFYKQNNIELTAASIHNDRATGLVEKLIQTLKRKFAWLN